MWVNGQRVDQLTEAQLMDVRDDLGMIFQEGALFDLADRIAKTSVTSYYEETDMPLEQVDGRVEEVLGLHRPGRAHRQDAVGAVGRAAAPRRHRPRDGVQAEDSALRRGDDRASIRLRRPRWTTRSSSCAISRASARSS